MDRHYSKRYRQTFPRDKAHKSLLETFQAIGFSSFTCRAQKDFKTNSSTFCISLEEKIPSKREGADKKKSNQKEKGHRKGNHES